LYQWNNQVANTFATVIYLLDFISDNGTQVKTTPNFSVLDVAKVGHHVQLCPIRSMIQQGDTIAMP
jgi:hypothetical protein